MSSGGGMVDTRDLKSLARKGVWVQVPPGVQREKFEIMKGASEQKSVNSCLGSSAGRAIDS